MSEKLFGTALPTSDNELLDVLPSSEWRFKRGQPSMRDPIFQQWFQTE
jgi:hypothetical protein